MVIPYIKLRQRQNVFCIIQGYNDVDVWGGYDSWSGDRMCYYYAGPNCEGLAAYANYGIAFITCRY